jgi:hypothetical protein
MNKKTIRGSRLSRTKACSWVVVSSTSLSSSDPLSSCELVCKSWASLAVVLFLISLLFCSLICKYVSFKRGMKDNERTRDGVGEVRREREEEVFEWFEA